jgi:hypothetical protein
MRDYGKVHSSFWTSQTTRTMSEDARSLAVYLLTCPHGTISGVFRLPDGYVCDDMQWSSERVNATLIELLNKGFANRCETTKWVWIVKHFDWNKPENPNQFKSAAKIASSIPDECAWKQEYMRINAFFLGLDYKQFDNPSETVPEPVAVTVAITVAEETPLPAKTNPPENGLDDGFDLFWQRYPKKIGKDDARKAWGKKKPRIDNVLEALSWQINSDQWTKQDGQFIPNPATYINQGRWKDEPLENNGRPF